MDSHHRQVEQSKILALHQFVCQDGILNSFFDRPDGDYQRCSLAKPLRWNNSFLGSQQRHIPNSGGQREKGVIGYFVTK
jgi:hypothetical protein